MTKQDDDFMRYILNASPAEIRAICDGIAAEPKATVGCFYLVQLLRTYADELQDSFERSGIRFEDEA